MFTLSAGLWPVPVPSPPPLNLRAKETESHRGAGAGPGPQGQWPWSPGLWAGRLQGPGRLPWRSPCPAGGDYKQRPGQALPAHFSFHSFTFVGFDTWRAPTSAPTSSAAAGQPGPQGKVPLPQRPLSVLSTLPESQRRPPPLSAHRPAGREEGPGCLWGWGGPQPCCSCQGCSPG